MKKLIVAIIFIAALASGTRAADWTNWSNFSSVTAIFQNGSQLWIAGHGGVATIDTTTLQKTFLKKTAGQLPSLMVEDMAHFAATGTTWIGTYDNGIVRVNNNVFTTFRFPDPTTRLYHIATDPAGTLWCATTDGLYKLSNNSFTQVSQSIIPNTWGIKALPDGRLLIASNQPIVYDPATDSVFMPHVSAFAYSNSSVEIKDDSSYYFATDHGSVIYVHDTTAVDITDSVISDGSLNEIIQLKYLADGTLLALKQDGSVYSYHGAGWAPYVYTADAQAASATFLFQRSSGELIAGGSAEGGVIKGLGSSTAISIRKFAINSDEINTITDKSDHEVWVQGGNQIGIYDMNAATFERVDTLPGAVGSNRGAITQWNGNFIALAYNNLYQWTGSAWAPLTIAGLPTLNILCMTSDSSGSLYVGSYNGVYVVSGSSVTHYDASNTSVLNNNDLIRAIHFDAVRNTIWMGTSLGIVKLNAGTFSIINSSNTPQMASYNYISAISQDINGDMWFGTAYGGLIRYDGTAYTVDVLPQSVGNQTVNGIAFDGSTMYAVDNVAGLWVKENGSWTNYNTSNSDVTADYMTSAYVDRNHNVWLTSMAYGSQDAFGIDIYNKTSVILSVRQVKEADALSVYPNPASSILMIDDARMTDGSSISLTDVMGRSYIYTVYAHRIDIEQLATGVYVLNAGAGTDPVRIVKR